MLRELRYLSAALAAILLSGCATTKAPSQQQLDALRSIDVVIAVPTRAFAFSPGDEVNTTLPAAVGTTMGYLSGSMLAGAPGALALGPALGLGVAAALMDAGTRHFAAAAAREAAGTVGTTVNDIDLHATVRLHLTASLPANRSATLRFVDTAWPALEPGKTVASNFVRVAGQSTSDATLFLGVFPLFRSEGDPFPRTFASALLVSRGGDMLMSVDLHFAGPVPPSLDRSEVVRWWAEGRYRRYVLQSVAAVVAPVAEALVPTPAAVARSDAVRRHYLASGNLRKPDAPLRSSPCAFLDSSSGLVLRHEQRQAHVLIVAACEGEELTRVSAATVVRDRTTAELAGMGSARERSPIVEGIDPDLVWFTRPAVGVPFVAARAPVR